MDKSYTLDRIESHIVYRLIDPRDQSIKYIGITTDAKRRRKQHLHNHPKFYLNRRKEAWIQELRTLGLEPILEVIEQQPTKLLARGAERDWIRHYRLDGLDLLNNELRWMCNEQF